MSTIQEVNDYTIFLYDAIKKHRGQSIVIKKNMHFHGLAVKAGDKRLFESIVKTIFKIKNDIPLKIIFTSKNDIIAKGPDNSKYATLKYLGSKQAPENLRMKKKPAEEGARNGQRRL